MLLLDDMKRIWRYLEVVALRDITWKTMRFGFWLRGRKRPVCNAVRLRTAQHFGKRTSVRAGAIFGEVTLRARPHFTSLDSRSSDL